MGVVQMRAIGRVPAESNAGSLVFARSRLVGFFGDSRAFLSFSGSNGHDYLKGYGIAFWAQKWANGCVTFPSSLNGGKAGETTQDMLGRQAAYIATLKAAGATMVLVIAGTNDRTGNKLTLGQSKTNIQRIVSNFQEAGIAVVLVSETPRGTGSSSYELTAAQASDLYQLHLWIERVMSRVCLVANVWDSWIDAASGALFRPLAQMVMDGIHPSKIGGMWAGKAVAAKLMLLSRRLPTLAHSSDVWSSSNPQGNLTANALVTGTSGAIAASCNPTAGSVLATGWNAEASNMAGVTTTWSKEMSAGEEWQRIDLAGIATAAAAPELITYVDLNLAALADGDKIRATGLLGSRGTGLAAVGLALMVVPGYSLKLDGEDSDNTQPWPSQRLGPFPYESTALAFSASAGLTLVRVRVQINLQAKAAVNARVWFSKTGALKVTYG